MKCFQYVIVVWTSIYLTTSSLHAADAQPAPRQRLLMDAGWRFTSKDRADTTAKRYGTCFLLLSSCTNNSELQIISGRPGALYFLDDRLFVDRFERRRSYLPPPRDFCDLLLSCFVLKGKPKWGRSATSVHNET